MNELITQRQADVLFGVVLALGVIAAPMAAFVARRRRQSAPMAALAVGGPPVLVGLMWRVYNVVTDRLGLDTVKNLIVNAALFVLVGAICGVVWALVTTQQQRKENGDV